MKNIIILSIIVFGVSDFVIGQSKSGYQIESRKPKKNTNTKTGGQSSKGGSDVLDNFFIQPNFGFSFGNNQIYLNLAPTIGYKILDGWDAGVGFSYTYSKSEVPGLIPYKTNTVGGNLFTRYLIKPPFFVMAQYELLGTKLTVTDTSLPIVYDDSRIYYDAFLLGGGVIQPIGRNGGFVLSVLYNLSYDDSKPLENGPYSSPYVINAGFMFGL